MGLLFFSACVVLLSLAAPSAATSSEDDGWKMARRFHGFRYELSFPLGSAQSAGFAEAIKEHADQNKCFGWVQEPRARTYVGEVRCTKKAGLEFQGWLERWEQDETKGKNKLELRVYEDSKIRLHFTHFKQLDEQRDTCFIDAPHRCAHSVPTDQGEEGAAEPSLGSGEL